MRFRITYGEPTPLQKIANAVKATDVTYRELEDFEECARDAARDLGARLDGFPITVGGTTITREQAWHTMAAHVKNIRLAVEDLWKTLEASRETSVQAIDSRPNTEPKGWPMRRFARMIGAKPDEK
jgi:hypothetical protein